MTYQYEMTSQPPPAAGQKAERLVKADGTSFEHLLLHHDNGVMAADKIAPLLDKFLDGYLDVYEDPAVEEDGFTLDDDIAMTLVGLGLRHAASRQQALLDAADNDVLRDWALARVPGDPGHAGPSIDKALAPVFEVIGLRAVTEETLPGLVWDGPIPLVLVDQRYADRFETPRPTGNVDWLDFGSELAALRTVIAGTGWTYLGLD